MKSTRIPAIDATRFVVIIVASALCLWSIPASAQPPPERLSDKEVKTLINQVDESSDRFKSNLDDKLKDSTVHGLNGDAKVANVLQDYRENTQKLKDRFNDNYAASTEVATVLKQAAPIDAFMQGTSGAMKGRSEWDSEAASLKHLAAAYGTVFPMPSGGTTERISDKETAAAAAGIETAAKELKDAIGGLTLSQPEKDAARKEVEALIKLADTVKDHAGDGKPNTTEVRQLVEQVARIQTFVGAHEVPPIQGPWQSARTSLVKLQRAFGLVR